MNEEAKHAIDKLIEAMHYTRSKVQDKEDFEYIWDGYLTLVHALHTPVENYSVSIDPPALKQKPAESGEKK